MLSEMSIGHCPVCNRDKSHDKLMHWAADNKFAACGKPVGTKYPERPHYIINKDCIVPVTCPPCKRAQAVYVNLTQDRKE